MEAVKMVAEAVICIQAQLISYQKFAFRIYYSLNLMI